MMVFENTSKRSAQDLVVNVIEPKKRKVEFADEVSMRDIETENCHNGENISTEMYRRFVKSALDDLEKVCSTSIFPFVL